MERKIVWNKQPSRFLAQSLKWISLDSIFQAERVEKEILEAISDLLAYPEKHPPDKFKKNNPGNFRAFEKLSFTYREHDGGRKDFE
jgi:hypothetical protein